MKNLKISDEAHKLLKLYCVENNLRMNEYASVMISQIITKLQSQELNEKRLHETSQ